MNNIFVKETEGIMIHKVMCLIHNGILTTIGLSRMMDLFFLFNGGNMRLNRFSSVTRINKSFSVIFDLTKVLRVPL